MSVIEQIDAYINSLTEPKRTEMNTLHKLIMNQMPSCKLWYLDGKNIENKTVSNPNIGYGFYTIKYADGSTKDFYQIGLSANTAGISVYIMGIKDKTFLNQTFGVTIGKAKVTSYCISFKSIKEINLEILKAIIKYRIEVPSE